MPPDTHLLTLQGLSLQFVKVAYQVQCAVRPLNAPRNCGEVAEFETGGVDITKDATFTGA